EFAPALLGGERFSQNLDLATGAAGRVQALTQLAELLLLAQEIMLGANCILGFPASDSERADVAGRARGLCAIAQLVARGLDVVAAGRLTQDDAREIGVFGLEQVVQ